MKTALLALVAAAICLRAAADVRPGPGYVITDLGPLQTTQYGYVERGAFALNDAGQVVGGDTRAFLWSDGEKTDLGALPEEGPEDFAFSVAYGINNCGQVVGNSGSFGPIFMSGLQFSRGILYENGRLRQLTQQNASFKPYAINDRGQVVGLNAYRGFLYENGRLLPLGTLSHVPVGNRSTARAVSNAGQVVGWSTVNAGTSGPPYGAIDHPVKRQGKWVAETVQRVPTRTFFTHACLWRVSGKAIRSRDLGTLRGWANSYAYGINDRGKIIGSVSNAKGRPYGVDTDKEDMDRRVEAFLWGGDKMMGLGTLPGCRDSEAYGINNSDAIVGSSGHRAFVWQSGKMQDLNVLLPAASGWILEEARAINNKGQIAGSGTRDGQPHAFLLTPR